MGDLEKLADIYYNAVMKHAQVLPLGQSGKSTVEEGMGEAEEVAGTRRRVQQRLGQQTPQQKETQQEMNRRQQHQQLSAFLSQLQTNAPDYSKIPGWSRSFAIPVFQKILSGQKPSATELGWARADLRLRDYGQGDGWPAAVRQQAAQMLHMLQNYAAAKSSIVVQY